MRDVKRIMNFLDDLGAKWEKYFPDWRFGQLMMNFLGWASRVHGDPFFWEEEMFTKYFEEYISAVYTTFDDCPKGDE